MTDYFALLNAPRRPWLDAAALKETFLRLSAEVHPDRVHHQKADDQHEANQQFADFNAAYQCLREPRTRLRHLLELELDAKPSDLTNAPDDLMELFFSVGQTLRGADTVLAGKNAAASPLLQVDFFERAQELVDQLNQLRQPIVSRRDTLVTELRELDAAWDSTAPKPLPALLEIWRLLGFYDRWLAQIQERTVQLAF
jgi:DnaJ-domain-containing protein 1